jgi:hypothetical protein
MVLPFLKGFDIIKLWFFYICCGAFVFSIGYLTRTNTRYEDIITTNTEYTIDKQRKIEETTLYYYQTLKVGQHHTMDPIMEGIISCSLASSRGHPPIELLLHNTIFLFMSHYIV